MFSFAISLAYVFVICVANQLAYYLGPMITPVNSFFLIGFDMVIRDKLHDRLGFKKILALCLAAGAISLLINPSSKMIAYASVTALCASSLTDSIVYQILIKKKWFIKSNSSNIASSLVDSIVFPLIAFYSMNPIIILSQFAAKVSGGFLWSLLIGKIK